MVWIMGGEAEWVVCLWITSSRNRITTSVWAVCVVFRLAANILSQRVFMLKICLCWSVCRFYEHQVQPKCECSATVMRRFHRATWSSVCVCFFSYMTQGCCDLYEAERIFQDKMLINIKFAATSTISSRKTMWEKFIIRTSSCPWTLFRSHLEGNVCASLKITCSLLKFFRAKCMTENRVWI